MSTYQQTIDYLYASQPAFHLVGAAAYKPGLDNTYRLMAHLGNPHEKLRAVHVAGTNGKGSTSHLLKYCRHAHEREKCPVFRDAFRQLHKGRLV